MRPAAMRPHISHTPMQGFSYRVDKMNVGKPAFSSAQPGTEWSRPNCCAHGSSEWPPSPCVVFGPPDRSPNTRSLWDHLQSVVCLFLSSLSPLPSFLRHARIQKALLRVNIRIVVNTGPFCACACRGLKSGIV